MHQSICFSASRLSSNEYKKIFIKAEIIQASQGGVSVCVIIWYFHFLFDHNKLRFQRYVYFWHLSSKITLFLALKMDLDKIKKYAQ